jgi:F420-non-reducing hydrogenase iron-sulfur subunit
MNKRALKTCVFYCSNHLAAARFSDLGRGDGADVIQAISLPCSGKVDIPYLIKAFETGADGVAIVTCKKNECRHFEGNLRARKRAEGVQALLEEIGVAAERMAVFECDQLDTGRVLAGLEQFIERVRNLPSAHTPGAAANRQESMTA